MIRIEEFDALKSEDWSGVYAEVPPVVNEGVQMAFLRIRARERRRRQALRFAAVAACLCVVIGAGAMVMGRGTDAPDLVAAPVTELPVLSYDSIVWASPQDACFHIHDTCPQILGESVELQLVTALEFEKTVCSVCGSKIQLP